MRPLPQRNDGKNQVKSNSQHGSVESKTDLTFNQAGMFLSLAGDLKVSQVVNPNKTMRVEVKKEILYSKK